MNVFLNDYNDLCHERVLERITEVNPKGNVGYGFDTYTDRAKKLIKRDLKREDVEIEFLSGGTIANIIAITSNLMPYEGIIAADSGHINAHEAGSIEATGKKIETVATEDGKLNSLSIRKKYSQLSEEFTVSPKLVYISQTTELGTVYSLEEIKDIYATCKELDCYLYIDGARMAVGLAASDVQVEDLCSICDIFTLGGTKNGAIYGEALVIVNDALKKNIRRYMKQRGAVLAKGFILGAQFEALFEDGLYYELGKTSYERSIHLAQSLRDMGVKFYAEPQSNQVFILYPTEKIQGLAENNSFEVSPYSEDEKILRFVTSYRTTPEEIDNLIADLKKIN
ncbi:MAG: aminotransferase class V-fold PLP-dependent enzyme [Peptoniphilus sp.]|nr:aminotransferase class V-fold PLP-dependent enzyme [Peptoniphilus sp.]